MKLHIKVSLTPRTQSGVGKPIEVTVTADDIETISQTIAALITKYFQNELCDVVVSNLMIEINGKLYRSGEVPKYRTVNTAFDELEDDIINSAFRMYLSKEGPYDTDRVIGVAAKLGVMIPEED